MLTEPTERDRILAEKRGEHAPATVTVITDSRERVLKPEQDANLFETAARRALTYATTHGYDTIAHAGVSEFVAWPGGFKDDPLVYRYVWEFTAHRG